MFLSGFQWHRMIFRHYCLRQKALLKNPVYKCRQKQMDFMIFRIHADGIELPGFCLCKPIGIILCRHLGIAAPCKRFLRHNCKQCFFFPFFQLPMKMLPGIQSGDKVLRLFFPGCKFQLFKFLCPGINNAFFPGTVWKFFPDRYGKFLISRIVDWNDHCLCTLGII